MRGCVLLIVALRPSVGQRIGQHPPECPLAHHLFPAGRLVGRWVGGGGGGGGGKITGCSGRQKAATRRNMRREERVTVQGPVKKQQPDGMSHRGAEFC